VKTPLNDHIEFLCYNGSPCPSHHNDFKLLAGGTLPLDVNQCGSLAGLWYSTYANGECVKSRSSHPPQSPVPRPLPPALRPTPTPEPAPAPAPPLPLPPAEPAPPPPQSDSSLLWLLLPLVGLFLLYARPRGRRGDPS
jgi:hypothetical protein